MKQGTRGALVAGFLLIALLLLAGFNWSKPRILVLHSFDQNTRSVIKTNEGINRILAANRQPVSLRWHYLGMNHLADEPARQRAASLAQRSIDQFDPAILIAIDDEAQQYVARRYVGHEKIKLIFTAIDQEPKEYGYANQENVTGISEVLPLAAVRETLLHARGGRAAKIAVLTLPMPTGVGRMRQLALFDWEPHEVVAIHAHQDFAARQEAVTNMAQDVDVILVLSYQGLKVSKTDSSLISGNKIINWLNAHAKPLAIGISPDFVEEGGVFAIYPSAMEMGELATGYALTWLKTGTKAKLPFMESAHFRVGAREAMLRERKFVLPQIYVEFARPEENYYP